MKIARYNIVGEPVARARTGVVLEGDVIGDLRAGYALYLAEAQGDAQGQEIAAVRIPPDVTRILHAGAPARAAREAAAKFLAELRAKTPDAKSVLGEPLFVPLVRARLHNPLKPGRLVVVSGNTEGASGTPAVRHRAPSIAMGPVRDLPLPRPLDALTYGTGLAIVIGKRCHAVSESEASAAVAGYMVANEIEEPAGRVSRALEGDVGFRRCIIGPVLIDAADVSDVHALQMTTRVNGVVCQSGSTSRLKLRIARLVSALSVNALEPGDTIVTALLSDTAPAGSDNVPYLRAGDVLESEIEGLGVMRNKVVVEGA